jgi:uncharacterized repeat protein (TIGR01451 family)
MKVIIMKTYNNSSRLDETVQFLSKRIGLVTLMLGMGLIFSMPANAAPPAGTIISNTANASYTDSNSVVQNIASNTVTTTVSAVGSFTLTTDQTYDVAPGQIKAMLHTLTNTGNDTDAFNLTLNPALLSGSANSIKIYKDNGDGVYGAGDVELCSIGGATTCTGTNVSTGNLAAGGTYDFFVVVDVKSTAGNGDTITTIATAAPVPASTIPYATATATNTDILNVKLTAFTVDKTITTATSGVWNSAAGANITYRLAYTNTGSQAGPLYIEDTIGSGATVGFTYLTGTGLWSGSGTALTDAAGGDPSGIHYDYNITTAGKVTVYIENVAGGGTGYVEFHVQVKDSSVVAGTSQTTNHGSFGIPTNCTTGSCNSPTAPATLTNTGDSAFTVLVINSFTLLKEQAVATWAGSNCNAAGTYTMASQSQNPGDCIWYRITATNGGSNPVTNIAITDVIPANTTYAGSATCTKDAGVTGVATPTAPTVGSTGTVSCQTWTSIPATKNAYMEFAVRINP